MTWQDWLEKYFEKYRTNFVVQKLADFPYPWLNYNTPKYRKFISKEKYVSQREVFYDEIVFDIDMIKDNDKKQCKEQAIKIAKDICERLKKLDYSYSVWDTGGSGVHIHLFFPELFKYNSMENRIMKRTFLRKVGWGYLASSKDKNGGAVQLQGLPTIQLEEAPHRKGGKKKMLWEYNSGVPNLFKDFFLEAKNKEIKKNNLFKKYYDEFDKDKKPDAISFLEQEQFFNYKDGRDRALFILTGYYKQFYKGEELFDVLNKWNNKVLKGYFPKKVIRAKIKSARPCYARNYIMDMFDELGIDQKYIQSIENKGKK